MVEEVSRLRASLAQEYVPPRPRRISVETCVACALVVVVVHVVLTRNDVGALVKRSQDDEDPLFQRF